MSASHDSMKNPLSPEKKLEYAKMAFPDTNIEVAGDKESHVLDQLKKLSMSGVRHLTVVTGDDRREQFENLLKKYNGKKDKFNFKRIQFISAGKRDEKSEGTTGASATKVRTAAKAGDFKAFRSGIPKTIDDKTAQNMFKDIRIKYGIGNDEKPPEIGPKTPGHVLSIYAKRELGDKTGTQSKSEIQRRKRAGLWKGK